MGGAEDGGGDALMPTIVAARSLISESAGGGAGISSERAHRVSSDLRAAAGAGVTARSDAASTRQQPVACSEVSHGAPPAQQGIIPPSVDGTSGATAATQRNAARAAIGVQFRCDMMA